LVSGSAIDRFKSRRCQLANPIPRNSGIENNWESRGARKTGAWV